MTTTPSNLERYGTMGPGHFMLSDEASRRWGAYNGDGVDHPHNVEFRREVTAALKAHVDEVSDGRFRIIEIYAAGDPINAQPWQVGSVETTDAE